MKQSALGQGQVVEGLPKVHLEGAARPIGPQKQKGDGGKEEEGRPIDRRKQKNPRLDLGGSGFPSAVEGGEENGIGFPLGLRGEDPCHQVTGDEGGQHGDRRGVFAKLGPALCVVHGYGGVKSVILGQQIGFLLIREGQVGFVIEPGLEKLHPVGIKPVGILGGQSVDGEIIVGPKSRGKGFVQQIPHRFQGQLPVVGRSHFVPSLPTVLWEFTTS